MSISLEALAMAGVDSRYLDISFEEWEAEGLEHTPAHLLAEEEEDEDEDGGGGGRREVIRRGNKYTADDFNIPGFLETRQQAEYYEGCGVNYYKGKKVELVSGKGNLNVGFVGIVYKSLVRCLDSIKIIVRAI